jgi:hypothetical protein
MSYCPPLVMRLRVVNQRSNFGLWLPLFLLYPFLLAFFIIGEAMALVAFLLLWPFGWGKAILLTIPYLCRVICNLRNLEVDVAKKRETFFVSFK